MVRNSEAVHLDHPLYSTIPLGSPTYLSLSFYSVALHHCLLCHRFLMLICVMSVFLETGTNMPNSSKRSDGFYTVGMRDFEYDLPTPNTMIGCAAKCDETRYPDLKPKPELDLIPLD